VTERNLDVLRFIIWFERDNGWAPTLAEIGDGLDMRSKATVSWHLTTLEAKGLIRRSLCPSARALAVTEAGRRAAGVEGESERMADVHHGRGGPLDSASSHVGRTE
jgi:SOS-response transcriptional repressor LexA